MNSEVITKETIRKVIMIVATAAGNLLTKGKQLFVHFTKSLAVINRDGVVTAVACDDVLAVGRNARCIDAVQDTPAGDLKSLQHVVSARNAGFTRHRAEQSVHLIVQTKEACRKARDALEKKKLGETVERNLEHTMAAAAGDVQDIVIDFHV